MPEEDENIKTILYCKHCGAELAAVAKICPKCRYSHNELWYKLERFVYFVSIGMLIFSAATLISSCIQKRDASQALKRADEANKKADEANQKSETIYTELKTKSEYLTFYVDSLTTSFKKQQYIKTLGSRAIGYRDRNAYDELNDKINATTNNSDLISERNQVIQYWSNMGTPLDNYHLQLPLENDTATTEQNLSILSLANTLLFGNKYEDRIICARLLGDKPNDKNVEKILLLALLGENDIEVALRCGGNLKWLIGYHNDTEFLETDNIFKYWKNININTYKIDTTYKTLLVEYKNHLSKKARLSKNKYENLRLTKTIALVKSFI